MYCGSSQWDTWGDESGMFTTVANWNKQRLPLVRFAGAAWSVMVKILDYNNKLYNCFDVMCLGQISLLNLNGAATRLS